MKVKIWGGTGSSPSPIPSSAVQRKIVEVGQEIAQKRIPPEEVANYVESLPWHRTGVLGGNTACVEVKISEKITLIFDLGSGFRAKAMQMLYEYFESGKKKRPKATIFVSHTHLDHISGLYLAAPLFVADTCFQIFGPRRSGKSFEEIIFSHFEEPDYYPVFSDNMDAMNNGNIEFTSFSNINLIVIDKNGVARLENRYDYQKREDDEVLVRLFRHRAHPNLGCYHFRVEHQGKSLVYATDREEFMDGDDLESEFSADCDLLINDSQYLEKDIKTKRGYGHSSARMAGFSAKKCGAKRLCLFHFNPGYREIDAFCLKQEAEAEYPGEVLIGYEGLEIDI